MTKVNETSLALHYAARVSLLDAAISLVRHNHCLLSIYTLHNAAPCLAIAGHLSVRGPDTGFNARSMQIIRGYGGRRTQDTRVSNYLETTLNIAHHYHHHYHHHYDHLQVLDNQASETGKVRKSEAFLCEVSPVKLSAKMLKPSAKSFFNFVDEISGSVGFFQ